MQFDSPETARPFFKGPRVLSNFWYLICYNFCYILRKIAKLHFLDNAKCLKGLWKHAKN